MAPTSAAVSANSNRSGLRTSVSALVCPGALRMAVKAESAPATVQVRVDVRRIHTPESRAESAFSDMARMLRPHAGGAHGDGQGQGHDRGHDEGEDLGRGEDGRPEGEGDVEGDRHRLVQIVGSDERQRRQRQKHLAQPDGGHHHEHPRSAEQAAEHELGQRPDRGGQGDREHQGEPVLELEVGGQLDQEYRGDDAHLPLGEVEDPVGAVDQDQADGQQAVAEADDHPLEQDEVRRGEGQHRRRCLVRA